VTVRRYPSHQLGFREIHSADMLSKAVDELETVCTHTLPNLEDKLRKGFNG
jgi:hypothetical protein